MDESEERGAVQAAEYWRKLAFTGQPQQQTRWCWAAVTSSIAKFYQPRSTWQQCVIVQRFTKFSDCCTAAGGAGHCNVFGSTEDALRLVGCLDKNYSRPVANDLISKSINLKRPVAIRIDWRGGGSHAFAISGFLPGPNDASFFIQIDDPAYGRSVVSMKTLREGNYHGPGTKWTDTRMTLKKGS